MNLIKISKFLSLVLRHKPETIGISLDDEGWVDIEELLHACKKHGKKLSREELDLVVETNDKKRFAIRDGRIRANQGHSINVELNLKSLRPPDKLYHGTADKFMESIRHKGLLKQNRQYVHLSTEPATALNVGRRHGQPAVLTVLADQMYEDGYEFFLSENGVWLTDHVPWSYIEYNRHAR